MASDEEPTEVKKLEFIDILSMNKTQLIDELAKLGLDGGKLTKAEMQIALMQQLGLMKDSDDDTHTSSAKKANSDKASRASSEKSSSIKGDEDAEQVSVHSSRSNHELHLELRKLELEFERERRAQEFERERRSQELAERDKQRAHEIEMRRLELGCGPYAASSAAAVADNRTPGFRVDVAVKLMPKFSETDVEAFLLAFEKIAELNNFPRNKYAAILQAHLTGRALKVFTELSTTDCQDYNKLKAALLTAYAVVPEVYRKRFRNATKNSAETFSDFAFRLTNIFKRWMEGMKAYSDLKRMIEVILFEQFNENLEGDLRLWLLDQKPETLTEAANLADQYIAIRKQAKRQGQANGFPNRSVKPGPASPNKFNTAPEPNRDITEVKTVDDGNSTQVKSVASRISVPRERRIRCFYCKKLGHIASQCRKAKREQSGTSNSGSVPDMLVTRCERPEKNEIDLDIYAHVDKGFAPYTYDGIIVKPNGDEKQVTLLRDTGALQSIVRGSTVCVDDYIDTGEYRLIRGISANVITVPLVEIQLQSELWSGTFLVGVAESLPAGIDVLIGNDIAAAVRPIDTFVVTRSQTAKLRSDETTVKSVVSTSNDAAAAVEMGHSAINNEAQNNEAVDDSHFGLTTLFSESVELSSVSGKDDFIKLQHDDPDLDQLFLVAQDAKHLDNTKSYYFINDGILMRSWRHPHLPNVLNSNLTQIVVPKILRSQLLKLAHDIPASGHLGMKKTLQRLQAHFYWNTINGDVKTWCKTCDVCQRMGKGGSPERVPLHSLPLVDEPFKRVAIDIIGPLPECKESGNRFILTILDFATHFPEAIPLKQHVAKDVAQALISVFTRFGFPCELLSDQGSDFMSELMQIFNHDFHIEHLRTSAWHPETNGACERFNGTLKNMLRALSEKYSDAWDLALPWVLFAYREVPVETLGFSPFELLFGRFVKGPLALIKNAWLGKSKLNTAKRNVVQYILDIRERLRDAMSLATDHAKSERSRAKVWYDRKARTRSFEPGQKVLALLPLPNKPLQTQYYGPYEVLEKLGPVDYRIATPDRRKTERICHVNLLKLYHERDMHGSSNIVQTSHAANVLNSEVVTDALQASDINNQAEPDDAFRHVTVEQRADLDRLLREFGGVFSDKPGRTTWIMHHIELEPGSKPVRCTPYRLSPEKSKFLKEELDRLLTLGIIAESDSPWASPVILVPKDDSKTWRLCTDFRKANSLCVADPFPLPRIEELLDRVGSARFLTKIDMTKSYWQVPIDEESIPITGFVTPFGHFEWNFMPFGLRNAPATFSRLAAKLAKGLESFSAAYLDDFVIFSNTWSEHLDHIRQVLSRIRQAGLTLNIAKCEFAKAEIDYLGHHIGLGKVQPRAKKVEALLHFERPTTRKQLQAFLGLAGYYRRFIPHFADIASVLSDLLKKGQNFSWKESHERAFLDIKSRIATRPILRPPDFTKPFCMAVDASDVAIGATLFQLVDDIEHPICFLSKKLDVHQRKYSTVEKEALGLILAVRAFSVYFGSSSVTVFTDHSPLQFINRMANHNQKLLRWSLELGQYNLNLVHRRGRDNVLPDILSRPPL